MNMVRAGLSIAIAVALSLFVLAPAPQTASAATYTDSVTGFEYAFTSDEGRFAGTAAGDLPGFWNADVFHTALTTSATITGGTFDLWTRIDGAATHVSGDFAYGGTITQVSGFSGCTDQRYALNGSLEQVGPAGSPMDGSGAFSAVLTHHRRLFFGACVTYFATVTGTVDLTF